MRTVNNFLFFWKSNEIYSNWYMKPYTVEGITFTCSEQQFMYKKALFFNDLSTAKLILEESTPRKYKELGRKVKGFKTELWDEKCFEIMYQCCLDKFKDEVLKKQLISTLDLELVEASPYDTIWGIGLEENDPCILNKNTWRGKNLLGKVLMKVREELK